MIMSLDPEPITPTRFLKYNGSACTRSQEVPLRHQEHSPHRNQVQLETPVQPLVLQLQMMGEHVQAQQMS